MLFKKMLRDMGKHKTQFISIFLMAFLGVFIYSGIGGEWIGLRRNVNNYYKETNFANVWLYGSNFSAKNEKAIKQLSGIKETERSLVIDTIGKFKNNPKISLHFVEKNKISKVHRIKGADFSIDKDGIWLDDRFAHAHKLSIGDKISFIYNGISITKKIMGTIYSPEYVYLSNGNSMTPDFSSYGYAYMSHKFYPPAGKLIYTEMMLTSDTKDYKKLERDIKGAISGNYSVFLTRENHSSYAMFDQEIEQHKAMGAIFPIAFIAIALLTMLTTMTRIVNNQRIQIGTLKALGFKKNKIILHYVAYGFWLSLVGSILGAIVGPLTLPKLFYPSMSGFYTLPEWNSQFDISFILMAALTISLCTLVTYAACRKVLKDTPSKTLRPRAPKIVRHGLLEKTKLWKKLGFNVQWNLRDVTRNRIRSAMAIIGVFGCSALLVCAFGMNDDMKDLKNWQYEDINKFSSKLSIDQAANATQIKDVIKKTTGQAIMETAMEIKANNIKKSGDLTATDHVTLLKTTDEKRNYINLPKEGVSLTYKLANQLGVKKGDKITWHIFGNPKWLTTPVAEIYRSPSSQGIMVTKKWLQALGYTFTPTSILTPKEVRNKLPGISSIMNTAELVKDWDKLTESMITMVFILISAAALLAIVVLYNLGLLSFTEMERELATLKVIGLKSRKLRNLLLTQNLWLSAIGFILGVPGGTLLLNYMTSTMGDSFDMITVIHLSNMAISFAITFALSIIVNLMFSKKIRRLDMVASLKGAE